jgi:alkanesulfonate monooxygenase SsuD/methylene tetrahydromethanopterin reductase-like flavin-dependent oxidoreductase (luciferase family)
LLDELVVSGTPDEIAARLHQIQEAGVDELLVMRVNVADAETEDAVLVDILARETAAS